MTKGDQTKFRYFCFQERIVTLKGNAGSRKIVNYPINVFIDDTSGNKSKKWNPYHLWTMQFAGLPNEYKQKKTYNHFLVASNLVANLELGRPVIEDINYLYR